MLGNFRELVAGDLVLVESAYGFRGAQIFLFCSSLFLSPRAAPMNIGER